MNKIQKAFKQKSALRCMADGGSVRPTPEMLGSGMARHAGDVLARRPAQIESALDEALGDAPARPAARPAPAPAPAPTATPAKKPEEKSILRSFFGLADGGMAPPHAPLKHGGEVKGKGGPTDDKVGPVALSDEEYVLPADTAKAIGKDVLDAIRLATHKFVDPDEEKELRGMANGGTFYVDPQGVASETLPPNRLPVPATPAASNVIEGTATRVAGGAGAAAPTATSSLRTAVSSGGGRIGAAARGALPLAVMSGAADSYGDASSGYRKQFADSVGGSDSVAGSIGADALRTLGNIGNTLTLGTGERLGRGLSNLSSGGSFIDGFTQTPDRAAFNEREMGRVMAPPASGQTAAPTTTPADLTVRGMDTSAGALRLGKDPGNGFTQDDRFSGNGYRVYGRDNPNAGKPGESARQYIGVGTPGPQEDPIMGEIRSALRGLGQSSGGGGGGYSPSTANARDINARYDKLAQQLSGMYGPKGQGNLARHLVELEQARSAALGEDARNQSALRGQDLQASTAANGANLQARMQMLQTLGTLAGQRGQQSAQVQAAQLKALQDAQKLAQEGEEKGFERYTGAIGSMFVGPDGKPDAAEQERFTSFLQASDPKAREKFAAMAPQDQMTLLQNFKTLYDMNKARNDTATGGLLNSGAVTNRADMPADVREATWNDVWNNHLPLSDYLYSNLPGTNPNVAVTQSGQPVLMSKYATTDGNWDADKLDLIRRRTGKDQQGRSALRGN